MATLQGAAGEPETQDGPLTERMTNGSGKPRVDAQEAGQPARKRTARKSATKRNRARGKSRGKGAKAATPGPVFGTEPASMQDTELVATILFGSTDAESIGTAWRALAAAGGIGNLPRTSRTVLAGIEGVGPEGAARLSAAVETGRRAAAASERGAPIETPSQAGALAAAILGNRRRRHVGLLMLDERFQLCAEHRLLVGQREPDDEAIRAALRAGLEHGICRMIAMSNHPSGNGLPEREEVETTERLHAAAALVGIDLLDHVIVAGRQYYSFRQGGILPGRHDDYRAAGPLSRTPEGERA